jgi:multidrug efflux pump subunit AcrA (membrane-fusion protein)
MLKETSREARVELEFVNPDETFKPGMFIRAQIEYASKPDVTVIPVGAVVKRNNQEGVFLAEEENEKAKFVPVKIGITSGDLAEVIDPDPFTGNVVTLGQHLLVDGSPIILTHAGEGEQASSESRDDKELSGGTQRQGEQR